MKFISQYEDFVRVHRFRLQRFRSKRFRVQSFRVSRKAGFRVIFFSLTSAISKQAKAWGLERTIFMST